jgi:hypothetical protein
VRCYFEGNEFKNTFTYNDNDVSQLDTMQKNKKKKLVVGINHSGTNGETENVHKKIVFIFILFFPHFIPFEDIMTTDLS